MEELPVQPIETPHTLESGVNGQTITPLTKLPLQTGIGVVTVGEITIQEPVSNETDELPVETEIVESTV